MATQIAISLFFIPKSCLESSIRPFCNSDQVVIVSPLGMTYLREKKGGVKHVFTKRKTQKDFESDKLNHPISPESSLNRRELCQGQTAEIASDG